jgi:DNA polymerase-3 subunit gamma/tau
MRDALSFADQVVATSDAGITADSVRDALGLVAEDEYIAVLDLVAGKRAADVFPTVQRLADAGIDFGVFLAGLADVLRAQLAVALGGEAPGVAARTRDALAKHARTFAPGDLLRMLGALSEMEPRFRKSGQQQLLVEMLLVRFALIDRSVRIEELLDEIRGGGSPQSPPRGPAPRATAAKAAPPARAEAAPPAQPAEIERSAAINPAVEAGFLEAAQGRMTNESVTQQRLASLRQKDPILGATIDALDLELID